MAMVLPRIKWHGTTAQRMSLTAEAGVIGYDTDLKRLCIFDGVTLGGHIIDTDWKQEAFTGIDVATPITMSFNKTTGVLTVTPTLGYFNYFTGQDGAKKKHTVTGNVDFPAITATAGVWYFYFDADGVATATQTSTNWVDYTIARVYRLYWNTNISDSVYELFEAHTNTISAKDHKWKHQYGSIWTAGLDLVHNAITTGSPNASGLNTCVSMTTGSIMDDNLDYTITNSTGGGLWQQDLGNTTAASITSSNAGLFKVTYTSSTQLVKDAATRFPFLWNPSTNYPQTVINGTKTDVPNNSYFVVFLWAIQDPRNGEAIVADDYPTTFTKIADVSSATWGAMISLSPLLADKEIRPLYKLVYEVKSTYGADVKYACLRQVQDIRQSQVSVITAPSAMTDAADYVVSYDNSGFTGTNYTNARYYKWKSGRVTQSFTMAARTTITLPVAMNGDYTISHAVRAIPGITQAMVTSVFTPTATTLNHNCFATGTYYIDVTIDGFAA